MSSHDLLALVNLDEELKGVMLNTVDSHNSSFLQSELSLSAFMLEIVHAEVFNVVEVLLVLLAIFCAQVSKPVQVSWKIASVLAVKVVF